MYFIGDGEYVNLAAVSHLRAGSFSDVVVEDDADESGDRSHGDGDAWS